MSTPMDNRFFYPCVLQLCYLRLEMLELFKARWILIGCECVYHSSAGKNVIAASDSNNIVSLCRYSFGVDFPILMEL